MFLGAYVLTILIFNTQNRNINTNAHQGFRVYQTKIVENLVWNLASMMVLLMLIKHYTMTYTVDHFLMRPRENGRNLLLYSHSYLS